MNYTPEGTLLDTAENQKYISSAEGLREAMEKGIILEAVASVCGSSHSLTVDLPCGKGVIPREEGALGIAEGVTKDIAIISRVGRAVCFKVTEVSTDSSGNVSAVLSRRMAQEECRREYISRLSPGDVIPAKVTHLEQFGCFVDIGCGLPSMIPIDAISVSRISHPSDRFSVGDSIRAVVKSSDGERVCLTHRELLGTWEENSAGFSAGETVSGIVRSVEGYGIFVELTPNLAGLAELRPGISPGQRVSVFIKAVIPEKMKVKLIIVETCPDCRSSAASQHYFFTGDHMDHWIYPPACSDKCIRTDFA